MTMLREKGNSDIDNIVSSYNHHRKEYVKLWAKEKVWAKYKYRLPYRVSQDEKKKRIRWS